MVAVMVLVLYMRAAEDASAAAAPLVRPRISEEAASRCIVIEEDMNLLNELGEMGAGERSNGVSGEQQGQGLGMQPCNER